MTKLYLKETKEIYICEDDDRIIYIERDDLTGRITGLNFMQGAGDINHFEPYAKDDPELSKKWREFFVRYENYIKEGMELGLLNDFIWQHIDEEDYEYQE